MSRLFMMSVIGVAAMIVAGCPDGSNCESRDHTVCIEGVLYYADSCGNLETVLKQCTEGCRADGTACQEDSLPCQKPSDCPVGQGCKSNHTCGACSTDTECRSGEHCQAGVCVTACTGTCCDGDGNLLPAGTACNSWQEVRCSGTGCGADPQRRTVTQHCSGVSSSCDGPVTEGNWSTITQCGMNQLCWNDGTTGGCTGCDVACRDGACIGCSTEPCCKSGQLAGTDTACQTSTDYRCVGTGCGADINSRTTTRFCDGINLDCRGRTEYTNWTVIQDCPDDAVCVAQGAESHCQVCQAGCVAGACQEPCQPGPCCVGGQLSNTSTVCSSTDEYRCDGDICGGAAQTRVVTQYCSGASSDCNGTVESSQWTTEETCGNDAVCEADASGASCVTCEIGCTENGCTPCTDEPCCLNGSFRPASFQCDAWTEYRCSSGECGADAQQRAVRQYCSGSSYYCNGQTVPDAFLTIENCDPSDICQTDSLNYAECFACSNGCSGGQCNP